MSNEEFQRLVLEKLTGIEVRLENLESGQKDLESRQKYLELGQKGLESGQKNLELGQKGLESGQKNLELGQEEIKRELKAISEHTANLTEFREEITSKVDKISNKLYTIEMVTSQNWNDITVLKAAAN